ncbi:zinc peptidase-like protein [Acrasis kona]|uniref:Zinc peptidase-like protein n=1 Tax=Acrasis kona TaxID=1008807 RepID=A0AAW2ZJK6_9EUKA
MDPQHRLYVPLKFLFDTITKKLTTTCLLLFVAGLVFFFSWPFMTKNAYFSENALAVGHHAPKYEYEDSQYALQVSRDLKQAFIQGGKSEALIFLERTLNNFGLETKRHPYKIKREFLNGTATIRGTNLYGTVRAPRGSGKESIVLTAPLSQDKCDNMGLAVSLLKVINSFKWLHHDFILVISDDGGFSNQWSGEYAFIHSPVITTGRMRECITLDFDDFSFHQMAVVTEGVNGDVPNLDLVNTLIWIARHNDLSITLFQDGPPTSEDVHANGRAKHVPLPIYLYSNAIHAIEPLVDKFLSHHIRSILSIDEYYYKESKSRFVSSSIILLHNVYNSLLGVGTGPHAWFRQKMTHSITLTNAKTIPSGADYRHYRNPTANIKNVAKTVEGVFRSMNNLIEELHQSFFLYFMDSSVTYYGFEHYLPNLGVMGAPLIIQFVGNFYISDRKRPIHSALVVASSILCGFAVYVTPVVLTKLMGIRDLNQFLIGYVSTVIGSVLVMFCVIFPSIDRFYRVSLEQDKNENKTTEWRTLKAIAVGYTCFTMGVLLVFNAALYMASTVYIFCLCLCVNHIHNGRWSIVKVVQFLLLIVSSPFSVVACLLYGRSYYLGDSVQSQLESLYNGGVVDVYGNVLYITSTVVIVPVWLVFVKLVIDSIRKKIVE